MKAVEARKLSEESLTGPVIAPLLATAYKRIKDAAENGKFNINYPFYGAYPSPSEQAKEAALNHLRTLGYKVEHHQNPDPGDPRGSDWDEVSW